MPVAKVGRVRVTGPVTLTVFPPTTYDIVFPAGTVTVTPVPSFVASFAAASVVSAVVAAEAVTGATTPRAAIAEKVPIALRLKNVFAFIVVVEVVVLVCWWWFWYRSSQFDAFLNKEDA
jgi:hypothetical protein